MKIKHFLCLLTFVCSILLSMVSCSQFEQDEMGIGQTAGDPPIKASEYDQLKDTSLIQLANDTIIAVQ